MTNKKCLLLFSKTNFLIRCATVESDDGLFNGFVKSELVEAAALRVVSTGFSSVYFFYDPSYQSLNLGTYSALR